LFRDFEAVCKIKFWLLDIYRFLKNICLHVSSLVENNNILKDTGRADQPNLKSFSPGRFRETKVKLNRGNMIVMHCFN
jgi:hypothetical protein